VIFIEGGSKRQRKLTLDCASFAWLELMPRIVNCEINFIIKKLTVYEGTCLDTDNRVFQIEVDKKLGVSDDFITTIFHEMVHVKQYIRKELFSEINFYKTRDEYLKLPWEIEAYKLQEELLIKWKNQKTKHIGENL
tara:strand:- start:274 stop:681 length:408 start_codon:yes stop_codon:yes gene_type:complete